MANIRVIMNEEQALKIIDDIKNNICEVDLDELCGDKVDVTKNDETSKIYKKVIQAVRCGLVEWDEQENCLAQTLIKPLKCGTIVGEKLFYKNKIKLRDARDFNSTNQQEVIIKSLANVTGRPIQLIEELEGQDLTIAIGCLGFFDK